MLKIKLPHANAVPINKVVLTPSIVDGKPKNINIFANITPITNQTAIKKAAANKRSAANKIIKSTKSNRIFIPEALIFHHFKSNHKKTNTHSIPFSSLIFYNFL